VTGSRILPGLEISGPCHRRNIVVGQTLAQGVLIDRSGPQSLRIDVDDQRYQQNDAANQDLEEAVDVDVIEPVVEDAEDEQSDNGIADAAPAAEQAGAADHDRGDRIKQISVELVLLRAAEMGDAEHAADA